jgi:hypothetical protein
MSLLPSVNEWAEHQGTQKDREILDWLEKQASKGQIQIAKSILGTGYEVALLPKGGSVSVKVFKGGFRDCIEAAMRGRK